MLLTQSQFYKAHLPRKQQKIPELRSLFCVNYWHWTLNEVLFEPICFKQNMKRLLISVGREGYSTDQIIVQTLVRSIQKSINKCFHSFLPHKAAKLSFFVSTMPCKNTYTFSIVLDFVTLQLIYCYVQLKSWWSVVSNIVFFSDINTSNQNPTIWVLK